MSMSFSFDTRATVDPDVMIRNVGDESVILDLKTERYLGLDEVGTRMWTVIVGSSSIQSAYEALVDEYDVEPQRLRADLQDLIKRLTEERLITLEAVSERATQSA
jgi:Coenzyme PQQ synthesis protein D (PqqD)